MRRVIQLWIAKRCNETGLFESSSSTNILTLVALNLEQGL